MPVGSVRLKLLSEKASHRDFINLDLCVGGHDVTAIMERVFPRMFGAW
jgi:hypothetical protein